MTEVKVGDRVRVVLEGEVTQVDTRRGDFGVGSPGVDNYFHQDAKHFVSVEVLSRPLKVGDIVVGNAAYESLPPGAIVDGHPGAPDRTPFMRTAKGYVDFKGKVVYGPFSDGRKLLFLPS